MKKGGDGGAFCKGKKGKRTLGTGVSDLDRWILG